MCTGERFGPTFYHLLLLMVLSSAAASTQTTILPTARTTLSMAAYKAIPSVFAKMHPRYLTPTVSTIAMGGISIIVYVLMNYSSNGIGVIGDAVIAIGLYIAFYYGLTGFACAWYYRRELFKRPRNLILLGIAPLAGGLILFAVGIYAAIYYGHAENVETAPIAGITLPLWLGIGGLLVGVVLMLVSRPYFKEFFSRKTETAPPGLLDEPVEHAPAHF